jgi:hypothetical protein
MRVVPVKIEGAEWAAMVFRIREFLIGQRTQAISALREHLTEFGQFVPQGATNATRLIAIVADPQAQQDASAGTGSLRMDLYRKFHGHDSEISGLLGEYGFMPRLKML